MDFSNEQNFIRHDWVDIYDEATSEVSLLPDIRYSDHTVIGEGGSKKIYKAFDNHCDRWIALARIKNKSYSMGDSLDFIREIQLNSSLEHQNIIRIYDIGIDAEGPWFTMEMLEGDTLLEFLKKNNPSRDERLNLFTKICDAVAAAHQADILHLDLKPENIIIGALEKLTVCDWGLGEEKSTLTLYNEESYIKGTPGYMAPEQLNPTSPTMKQTDVFGLATLLYFILTETSPIQGSSQDEKKANTVDLKLKSQHHKNIPKRLIPLLKKGLSNKPTDRFKDAYQVNSEIKKYLKGCATEVENASPLMLGKLFIQRNKTASVITIIAFLALLVTSTFYISSLNKSQHNTQSALEETISAKKDADSKWAEAEQSKLVAEQTLEKLREEQDLRMNLHTDLVLLLRKNQQQALDDYNIAKANKIAKNIVDKSPDIHIANMELGLTYFAAQNLKTALAYFRKANLTDDDDLERIAERYPHNHKAITPELLKKVVNEIKLGRVHLISYILHHNYKTRKLDDHLNLVEFVFKKYNKNKVTLFEYDSKIKKLTINGSPLRFRSRDSKTRLGAHLLSSIPINTLSIDDTPTNKQTAHIIKPPTAKRVIFH